MALKSHVDCQWKINGLEQTDDYKVVLQGLQDSSVLIQDLASTGLVDSFCGCKDINSVYRLFYELCRDPSLPYARALKTLLSTTLEPPVMVPYNVLEEYLGLLGGVPVQAVHWEVVAGLLDNYSERQPLDALFGLLAELGASETVVKCLAPHLTRDFVSSPEAPLQTGHLLTITQYYPYKFTHERARAILARCVDKNAEITIEAIQLVYNLFWFWVDEPAAVYEYVMRVKNFTKDEGELGDASESDEFDLSLSEDDEGDADLHETDSASRHSHEMNELIDKFELVWKTLAEVQKPCSAASPQAAAESRLYLEIISDPSNDQLLERWLKEYPLYEPALTRSLCLHLLDSEFSLFQWQWLLTLLTKLPSELALDIVPHCLDALRPMKRFIQVIQVGNLKQRQDDSLNLRLQLWSLIDSLLDSNPDPDSNIHIGTALLRDLQLLQLLVPFLQYGIKDSTKDDNFQPVLSSILFKLADRCAPIIIRDRPLLLALNDLNQEQFPWITATLNIVNFKMS